MMIKPSDHLIEYLENQNIDVSDIVAHLPEQMPVQEHNLDGNELDEKNNDTKVEETQEKAPEEKPEEKKEEPSTENNVADVAPAVENITSTVVPEVQAPTAVQKPVVEAAPNAVAAPVQANKEPIAGIPVQPQAIKQPPVQVQPATNANATLNKLDE